MALAAALGAGLAVQLMLPPPPLAPALQPVRLPPPPAAAAASTTPDYPAILARPLFSPTRSAAALAGPAAPAGAFALLGVALAGRRASASLRDAGGALATLTPGERLQGWTLESVGRDRAVLRQGGVVQVLRVGAPAAGPAMAPAATPGAG